MTSRGRAVVLAAPSGTGKTTLARRLVHDSEDFVFSISATTREPRDDETDGVDYHFLTRQAFEARASAGELAEWAEVHGRLYGTPRSEIEGATSRGQNVVLDIDVQGARQIKASVPDSALIFVLPPSVDIMMTRLEGRGTEDPADIARRLRSALEELQAVSEFDYVVVNDDLEGCLKKIRGIVSGEVAAAPTVSPDVVRFREEIAGLLESEYAGL